MHERRPSSNSNSSIPDMGTPVRRKSVPSDSSASPSISRYGRSHKLKMQDDYVSTDKKVSAYLKLSPGNQMQYFSAHKEPRKKLSPKKLDRDNPEGTPRRGRPPKPSSKDKSGNEDTLKVTVKVEPQDPASQVDGCEWMVGDLAWARVGGHPFWPCVIALDPVLKIFTKTVRKGRTLVSQRMVHVQFFGDNGRRSWLNTTAIMSYNGRDAFIQLGDTILAGMRKKEPKQTSAFVIKPAVVQVWEKAVQEAEDLASATREERTEFFTKNFPPIQPLPFTREQLIELALSQPEPSPNKRGRKRKAEQSPVDENAKKKQIKLEEDSKDDQKSENSALEKSNQEESPLLSSTPRTIADRKKRQAILIQMARSNQNSPATSTPTVTPLAKPEVDYPSPVVVKQSYIKRVAVKEQTPEMVEKKKPKKIYTTNKEAAESQYDNVTNDHPKLNDKEINKGLLTKWNKIEEDQRGRRKSKNISKEKKEIEVTEETLEDSVTDSKDSSLMDIEEDVRSSKSNSPTPQAPASQKTSFTKRVNGKSLFSGAKAEKVCQICEKAGETVRCRGPCQGSYHPDCLTNPPKPQEPVITTPGKRGRKSKPKKSFESSPTSSDTSQPEEQLENGRINMKVDVAQVTKEETLKENAEVNGFVEKSTIDPQVEVIEPEVKSSTKMRKGSKDSDSAEENEGFRCKDCMEGRSQPCFVCHEYIEKKTGDAKLYRCITAYCGKVYHEECLKPWPQSQWRTNGNGKSCERGVMTCPQHTCHTCASDNPGVIKARYSNDKLVRCVRCPTTYHYGNYCVPAGSEILNNSQIICPQHYQPLKKAIIQHVNAAWCFICASGGTLICCDLCPTSFHADCLKIKLPADGSYVCEDCLTGRFPLYGEIVWVKLGTYRWWPAEILYPAMIPENILNLPHVRGEFAVKFFGSHDHYWVNRGRVFLYQDGDTAGKGNYKKSSVDNMFEKAAKEASEAQRKYIEEKATREAESRPGMKPPNYVKLKANRPVGNVRTMEMNLSNLSPCECDPKSDTPCAPESDCLNRILMVECNPLVCPAGEKCCNQLFEKRLYPPLQPYQTQERGWGLKTLVNLKKGDFVIEYVGEMIDEEEYKRRVIQMHENNEENFYFLTIDKDRMLDAGPKGNVARFMNHSCQPNCETQKWTVNGDTRVGLFALCDVPANTELVFNYNLESTGSDKKPCMCGAPNCSGFIGLKANKTNKEEKEDAKEKRVVKKKKSAVSKIHEEDCFVCGKRGELLRCDGKHCKKSYHLSCLNKKQRPQGYWLCPWHQCTICNKGRVQRCSLCVNSYCQEHAEGNIISDESGGFVCLKHNQVNDPEDLKQTLINGISKSTNKNKTMVEPMEVEEDSSKDSDSMSGLSKGDLPGNKEPINNNVIKTLSSADRRSRRSSSYSGGKSNVDMVNGNIKKTNIRRSRPSSVDDKLIISYKKENDIESTAHSDISAIINEVISNLPIKEEIESSDHERKNQEIQQEDLLEPIIENEIPIKFAETGDDIVRSESTQCELNTDTVAESVLEGKVELDHVNNSEATAEMITSGPDDTILEDKESKTEHCKLRNNKDNETTEINIIKTIKIENVELFQTNIHENNDLNNINNISDVDGISSIVTNPLEPNRIKPFTETVGKENDNESRENKNESIEQITEISCKPESPANSSPTTQNSNNQSPENKLAEKRTSGIMQSCEDHVDDFELSYSECSNDKTYKSVNDSESSIEMKFTGCTSEGDKSVVNSIDELKNNSELSNCIEQSNPMEVA